MAHSVQVSPGTDTTGGSGVPVRLGLSLPANPRVNSCRDPRVTAWAPMVYSSDLACVLDFSLQRTPSAKNLGAFPMRSQKIEKRDGTILRLPNLHVKVISHLSAHKYPRKIVAATPLRQMARYIATRLYRNIVQLAWQEPCMKR